MCLEFSLTPVDQQFDAHPFFLIEFETALSTESVDIPLEMAALALTINDGELSSFLKFVDPGVIPHWYIEFPGPFLTFF